MGKTAEKHRPANPKPHQMKKTVADKVVYVEGSNPTRGIRNNAFQQALKERKQLRARRRAAWGAYSPGEDGKLYPKELSR